MFEIARCIGVLHDARLAPRGTGEDRPVVTELKVTIDVDEEVEHDGQTFSAHDAADYLFPSYALMAARMGDLNDDDEAHPGIKLETAIKLETVTFVISDEGGEVWRFSRCKITGGQPKMTIDVEGSATISLKFSATMTEEQTGQLKRYLGKEVMISAHQTQQEMFGSVTRVRSAAHQVPLDGGMTGAELRELRDGRGMTRPELAEALGCSRKTIQRYESGERIMPPDFSLRAREALAQAAS